MIVYTLYNTYFLKSTNEVKYEKKEKYKQEKNTVKTTPFASESHLCPPPPRNTMAKSEKTFLGKSVK